MSASEALIRAEVTWLLASAVGPRCSQAITEEDEEEEGVKLPNRKVSTPDYGPSETEYLFSTCSQEPVASRRNSSRAYV
jgi:hypothetical protein